MNSDTVDYDDSCLIVRYLASMRPFAQSFDIYLTQVSFEYSLCVSNLFVKVQKNFNVKIRVDWFVFTVIFFYLLRSCEFLGKVLSL